MCLYVCCVVAVVMVVVIVVVGAFGVAVSAVGVDEFR